ncbi:MAG: SAM-dependent methyltransferase [Aureliella sp.]
MITCPSVEKSVIRTHYNIGTLFYRLMWGPHLHHGLWNGDESPQRAARHLTEELARLARIQNAERIVDVGCGMGGSSIWLARQRECTVTGVTISPVQRRWATTSSWLKGTAGRTQFLHADAEQIELKPGSRDVVWSIECTEHLFDKAAFFAKARSWLAPGGRIAICAWLAGHDQQAEQTQRLVTEVCEGFFCPSLGTQADYENWLTATGLKLEHSLLWTDRVLKTWEICRDRVRRSGVRNLARVLGRDHVLFLDRFDAILEAYRTRAMEYGCFVASAV